MTLIQQAWVQLLVLVPAFFVVVLVEMFRQGRVDKARAFRGMLAVLAALALAIAAGGLIAWLSWGWVTSLESSVCEQPAVKDALGMYGCYNLFTYAMLLGNPFRLVPAFFGLAAALALFWPGRAALRRRDWVLLGVLLLGLALIPPLLTGGNFLYSMGMGILPVVWIALVWRAPLRGMAGWLVFGLAAAALAWAGALYLFRADTLFSESPARFNFLPQLLLFLLLPATAFLVAARVLAGDDGAGYPPAESGEGTTGRPRPVPAPLLGGLAVLAIAFMGYVAYYETIWDRIMDGSSAIAIQTAAVVGVVAGAMLLAFTAAGARKLTALIFAIAALVIVYLVPAYARIPEAQAVTAERGLRISRAVERYQARTGQYPASLDDLVPRDLWLLQPPVMIRGLGWCYQGGNTEGGFYRLGYVYRPVRGVPPEYYNVRVVKSAGALPEGAWGCEEELERQQELARQMYTGP